MTEKEITKLYSILDESKKIVFFGGAGVSTESGIPDFRSKDGLYNQHDVKFDKYQPEYLLSRDCLFNEPKVFYEFYRQKMNIKDIEPNITHKVLAKMEERGILKAIITQNIDGLHQKAGSKTVYEIHGNTLRNYCAKCKKEYPSDYIFTNKDAIPKCECRGLIRPDITLYGEALPNKALKDAMDSLHEADCLIVAGTSLQVHPAAELIYEFYGNHMIVINREKLNVKLNPEIDMEINESMGTVFQLIDKYLTEGVL